MYIEAVKSSWKIFTEVGTYTVFEKPSKYALQT